ncbi:MAG: trypsin-like peptidase domain-containing protein [Thermoanaerobaculia bacterium]
MKKLNSLVTFLFVLLTILPACRQNAETAEAQAPPVAQAKPPAIPKSVSAKRITPVVVAAHNILPSVVNIQAEAVIRQRTMDPFFGFFQPDRAVQTESIGSGFVWQSDGIIVTNNHVIEGASRISVNLQDGRQFPATVIGVDPDSDLAVLRVKATGLPAAPIGTSSDLLIGETVIAVGNPFGLSGSVTTGVVSALGRSVPEKNAGRTFTDFIQTDASINPGNSGGPLLNIEGRVIGINVAIYAQAQNIGFAIPVDRAKKVIGDLLRYGSFHSAWIGVATTTVTREEAKRMGLGVAQGALVAHVFSGSPAERAGLRRGDIITSVDGHAVDSREGFNTYTATVSADSPIPLTVVRGGGKQTISLTPVEPPRNLGLQILRDVTGISATDRGGNIVVSSVDRGSRADQIGLAPGDLIVGVNGADVGSVKDLNSEMINGADRSSIVLSVARGRYIYSLTFPMDVDQGASV